MESSTSKIILAFLAGAAAGTALGILLAPEKGEKTREKIRGSFDDLSDKARDLYGKYVTPKKAKLEDDEAL